MPDTNLVNHFDTVNSAEGLAGAKVDTSDPMALFEYDRESKSRTGSYGLGSEGESENLQRVGLGSRLLFKGRWFR